MAKGLVDVMTPLFNTTAGAISYSVNYAFNDVVK